MNLQRILCRPNYSKPRTRRSCVTWSVFLLMFYAFSVWILLKILQSSFLNYPVIEVESKREDLLESIDLDCRSIIKGDPRVIKRALSWTYDADSIEEAILEEHGDKCDALNQLFSFRKEALSEEEKEFPLAYGMIIHKDIVQVLFMISSFYHPQNEYCMAVSGSADPSFKVIARRLSSCFPNIHVMTRPPIKWGSFEIINSTFACLSHLSSLKTKWKYYQYLSGVDVPLRTNLEMVKIFKALNGSPNMEISPYQTKRALTKNITESPLPLFKSSLSALISRATADVMATSNRTKELLNFLKSQRIPDEGFWATMTGNFKEFPIVGGFNAQDILDFKTKIETREWKQQASLFNYNETRWRNYLSRWQVWEKKGCAGKMTSSSCSFGVKDLASIMKQPHLVAHKFYIDFQPAAFFCALKEIRRRSLNPTPFDTKLYSELPLVEISKGIPLENLTHPYWLF